MGGGFKLWLFVEVGKWQWWWGNVVERFRVDLLWCESYVRGGF